MFRKPFRHYGYGPWQRHAPMSDEPEQGEEQECWEHDPRRSRDAHFAARDGWRQFRPHGMHPRQARAWFAARKPFDHFFGRGGPFGGHGDPFGDDPFDGDSGPQRQRRGDIKFILLELLAEQPRHGYELIKEIEQRYAGFYRPSPGSIYPTLQMLEEGGQLTSEQNSGKRVYSITDAGREMLAEYQQQNQATRGHGRMHDFRHGKRPEMQQLGRSIAALMMGLRQIAQHGTPEQIQAATKVFDTARRELYAILAQTDDEKPA